MQNSRRKQIVAAFLFCCCSWWPYIEILGRLVLIEIRHDMPRFQKLEEIALEKLSLIPNKNVPQTLWRSQVTLTSIVNSYLRSSRNPTIISKMHLMTSSKRHSLKLLWLFQVFRRDQMGLKLFVVPIREVFNQCNEVWQFLKEIINRIENVQNWLFLGTTSASNNIFKCCPLFNYFMNSRSDYFDFHS